MVFEVSPIFDLNPEPPEEWRAKPYREYKQTEDYKKRRDKNCVICHERPFRRAENYALCAQKARSQHGFGCFLASFFASKRTEVVEFARHRRGQLFVDIDNTISDAWKRIQRVSRHFRQAFNVEKYREKYEKAHFLFPFE